jgi:vacuolar-type H+-ATPase subunit E/Vma4
MGLAHLLEALERDANGEIARLRAEAVAEADRITAASATLVEQRRRASLDEDERRGRHEVERALTIARRAARRALLEARQRMLDRVFAAARVALPAAVREPAFRATLPAAIVSALAAIGPGPVIIHCPRAIAPDLKGFQPADRITVTADETVGSGFVMRAADGSIEVDDTLDGRLERSRPVLARRVLERLGGDA